MIKSEENFLKKLINKYTKEETFEKKYPLTSNPFETQDIIKAAETLLSGRITMSSITKKFEKEFAKFIGAKHALMVNSGSSANLLATFALINPLKRNKLNRGDEYLIPSLC